MQPRSLKQITGERPRCQYCDKPLKPFTALVEVMGHIDEPPTAEAMLRMPGISTGPWNPHEAVKAGYDRSLVYRIKHKLFLGADATWLRFFTGQYHGYGYAWDESNNRTTLFCGYMCGVHFGVACWKAGMRIKEKPNVSVTSTPNEDNRNAEDSVV